MSTNADGYGPFAQEMPLKETEYGGAAGLIRGKGGVPGAERDALESEERLGMAYRTDADDPSGVDPATGLVVPEEGA